MKGLSSGSPLAFGLDTTSRPLCNRNAARDLHRRPGSRLFCVNEYGTSNRYSMFFSSDTIHRLFKAGPTRVDLGRQSMEIVPLCCAEEHKRTRRWYHCGATSLPRIRDVEAIAVTGREHECIGYVGRYRGRDRITLRHRLPVGPSRRIRSKCLIWVGAYGQMITVGCRRPLLALR